MAGGPSVGAGNLYFEPGSATPEEILAGVDRGLYVTDLIGFGVDLVSGDFSQGAVGHWIEKGRLVHPVHEVTIAGNLRQMLPDVDAVGTTSSSGLVRLSHAAHQEDDGQRELVASASGRPREGRKTW